MKTLAIAAVVSCAVAVLVAQKSTPADVAAKLTGTWKVNRELSPSLGRGRGRGGGQAEAGQPRLVLASFQRGGGGARGHLQLVERLQRDLGHDAPLMISTGCTRVALRAGK